MSEFFIVNDDGDTTPLGDLKEVTIEESDDYSVNLNNIVSSTNSMSASFTLLTKISKDALNSIYGIRTYVLELVPNDTVRHLAMYAKKERTRKKNFNRAIKILEKGE